LTNPRPEDFDTEDVARTLAYINRYAGQYGTYSVAQHAVLVSKCLRAFGHSARVQLAGLHHDDAEVVTSDVPSPVKRICPDVQALEAKLQAAINERYGVDVNCKEVREVDQIIYHAEVNRLVPRDARWMYPGTEGKPRFTTTWASMRPWSPAEAFANYMDCHDRLVHEMQSDDSDLDNDLTELYAAMGIEE
jgi:hypothetical protein